MASAPQGYIPPWKRGDYDSGISMLKPKPVTDPKPTPAPTTPTKTATTVQGAKTTADANQITAGAPKSADQMNVADYAGQVALDPSLAVSGGTSLVEQNKTGTMNPNTGAIDPNQSKYQMDADKINKTAAQGSTATAATPQEREAEGYDAELTADKVAGEDMEAAQGEVSDKAQVDPETGQIDLKSIESGYNPDGTLNPTGQALNDFASLDLDDVDPRATVKGQLEQLQSDFTGPNGEPKIPVYAQGAARAVSRIASFSGMTGTAATAAMATAMMESSIQVAEKDAAFYQTVSLTNLSNEQAQIINKAGILANMELSNADNRMAAAIQNSKAFLEMDLKNLDNEQQAAVINTQNRVQSILEDAKAVNASRMFEAESSNEMGMFYDNLSSQISQFNANQKNAMSQFNTGEANSMSKFNAELENNREQFYKEMQYNIDVANAKQRLAITLQDDQQSFEAAATDVKNMVDISTEQLNQLWDRSDSLLDYIWKSTESELDRKNSLAVATLQAQTQKDIASTQAKSQDKAGFGAVLGSITGAIAGSDQFLDFLF